MVFISYGKKLRLKEVDKLLQITHAVSREVRLQTQLPDPSSAALYLCAALALVQAPLSTTHCAGLAIPWGTLPVSRCA